MNFLIKITATRGVLFAFLLAVLLMNGCQQKGQQESEPKAVFATTQSLAKPVLEVQSIGSSQLKLNRMASCYASMCHGQQSISSQQNENSAASCSFNEAILWSRFDPHVFSYECLKSPFSKQLMEKLKDPVAAEKNPRCLSCHAPQLIAAESATVSFSKTECLMCHGTELAWVDEHMNWQNFSGEDKKAAYTKTGMRELTHPADRIKLCLECHIGLPAYRNAMDRTSTVAKEVNHDLIAAGHPRLDFHYGSFRRAMKPHWNDEEKRRGDENRLSLWVIAQWYAMKSHVQLLHSHIKPGNHFNSLPDFADISCFSCHHDLNTNVNLFQGTSSKRESLWENSSRFFFANMVQHLVIPNVDPSQKEKLGHILIHIKRIEDSFQLNQLSKMKSRQKELNEALMIFNDLNLDDEIRKIAAINLNVSEVNLFLEWIKTDERKQEQLNAFHWHRSISAMQLLKEIGIEYGKENSQWSEYLKKREAVESQYDFLHHSSKQKQQTVRYLYNSPKKVHDHTDEEYQKYFAKQKQYYDLIRTIPPIQ